MLESLQRLDPKIIQRFLETRDEKSCGIPPALATYILQVNEAADLFKENKSISSCAQELQKKYPDISISTARGRINDAINYLHADSTVTAESWNNYYADHMMKLSEVASENDNIKEARLCAMLARDYRIEASKNIIDKRLLDHKPQIVSPDFELERMGIKRQGLLGAWKKAQELINSRDVPESEKTRMLKEVNQEFNIVDVEHEDA